jgi:hypothetical protein
LKIQEKKQLSWKRSDAPEPRSTESPSVSREDGKREANEPLYLLRYE